VTVTVNTKEASAAELQPLPRSQDRLTYALWIPLQGLGLFGLMLSMAKGRRKKLPLQIGLALLLTALLFVSGCAGGTGIAQHQQETPPGTYTISVSGTSGSLNHSLPLTLIVQ
jgi:membrane protease YdiL (CAAX protease family)